MPTEVLVSLRKFAASGSFGPITPGCSPAELESAFGPPEVTGGQYRRHRQPSIWKYGDVQFFFARLGGLYMVHIDTFSGPDGRPTGWGGLRLDPWCVREELPIREFLDATAEAGCEPQMRQEPQYERVVVSLASGVEVGFSTGGALFGVWRSWNTEPGTKTKVAGAQSR